MINGATKFGLKLASVAACLFVGGCVVNAPPQPNDPYYAPVMQPAPVPAPVSNGSLYSQATSVTLYEDHKARRVGDLLTIQLREATTSSKSSTTDVSKESEVGIPTAEQFGTMLGLDNLDLLTSLQANREFSGGADADQRNRLQGEITVTVVDVYPNGAMAVRGEKWMTLNHGDEFIRISGLVRPEDVSPDNVVNSTRVANARISYSGTGSMASANRMGWLTRFFNSPLFPF